MSNGPIKPFQKDDRQSSMFRLVDRERAGLMSMESIEDVRARRNTGTTGKELREFWEEVFAVDTFTLEDLYPYRVRAAWRLLREIAFLYGWIEAPSQTLDEALNMSPSPWHKETAPFDPLQDSLLETLLDENFAVMLMPPNGTGEETEYAIKTDAPLQKYVTVLAHVAHRRLNVARTRDGRYGLAGLLDPKIVRDAMPGPREIIEFEALIVRETLQTLVKDTFHEAEDELRKKYDLSEREVLHVMAMARRLARSRIDIDDLEGARALCILRMEQAISQAQEAFDHRATITGIEKLAKLHGIDRGDSDQDVEGMANVVHDVSSSRRKIPKKTSDDG